MGDDFSLQHEALMVGAQKLSWQANDEKEVEKTFFRRNIKIHSLRNQQMHIE